MTKTSTLLLACGLLAGCAVGPDYQRPPLALPDRFAPGTLPALAAPAPGATPTADDPPPQRLVPATDVPAEWWRTFHSPALDEWVGAALAHNPNVEAAEAALRVARENAAAENGAFWPSVALNFQPTRQKVSQDVASPVANNATLFNLHTAQVTVSYAPDVFGATRRSVEAANAQSEQQRFQLEASKLALTSNVVVAAITEASLRAQLAATHEIIEEQAAVLRSYQRQQALGQVSAADVDAQLANLAASEATLPPLDKQLAAQRNLLLAMAGRYPADDGPQHFELDAIELPVELPLVLPASLVEHRPDVKAAEAQLQAASAGIGIAVAARLPNVLLGVNAYGSSALSLGQLFTSSTTFWTLAANVTQPLIDGGTLKTARPCCRPSRTSPMRCRRWTPTPASCAPPPPPTAPPPRACSAAATSCAWATAARWRCCRRSRPRSRPD
jgi:NodT family efflux transporter outer membrane factor (OMF) lipoprotein